MPNYIEVNWRDRYQIHDVPVAVADHDGGCLIAALSGPRFCLWGKDQIEAEAIAERAIKYWLTIRMPTLGNP